MSGRLTARLNRIAAAVADPGEDRRERERRAWWERTWEARRDVLGRIDADLHPPILDALAEIDRTGVERPAVANWVSHAIHALPTRPLPNRIPRAFIEFLLTNPDVTFVHDCGRCGLSVPIWFVRDTRHTADVIRERGGTLAIYPACPACGGKTGYHAYRHERARGEA